MCIIIKYVIVTLTTNVYVGVYTNLLMYNNYHELVIYATSLKTVLFKAIQNSNTSCGWTIIDWFLENLKKIEYHVTYFVK